MWCHLCSEDFKDFQAFKIHIIEVHRKSSELCKESSESEESEHESAEISDDDIVASNMSQVKYYYSDHSMTAKNKSDNDAAANMSQENGYDSDSSMTPVNKSDDTIAVSSLPVKCYDSDHDVAAKCNSHKTAALKNSLKKEHHDESKISVLNTSPRKRKLRRNTTNKPVKKSVSNKSTKQPKLSSILKKRATKRKKKVAFSKKVLPKRRMSAVSYREESPELSDSNESDHSKNLFNDVNNHVNSQPVSSNSINPESVPVNNYVINSQPISNNNPVYLVNPYVGQGVNNYVVGNQAVQPPVYVVNTVSNSVTPKTEKCFKFCSSNILKWLTKLNELCKNMQYPLPTSFFKQVKTLHQAIFDNYCSATAREETSAVLKVYEELDCMIHKHINSINNTLSVL